MSSLILTDLARPAGVVAAPARLAPANLRQDAVYPRPPFSHLPRPQEGPLGAEDQSRPPPRPRAVRVSGEGWCVKHQFGRIDGKFSVKWCRVGSYDGG